MQILVDIQQNSTTVTDIPLESDFNKWISIAVETKITKAELCIVIIDKEEMILLNQQYRNKKDATNVLSFPAKIPSDLALNILGDIVICAPVVVEEAEQQHKHRLHHWAHLTIHGTLHLLGYDHETEEEAVIMEKLEIEMMKKLGYPDPYLVIHEEYSHE